LIQHAVTRSATKRVTLDIDSSESPVHGAQEQSAYNGHFESVCYHPLFVFNPGGDCVAAKLRPGNVHSADGWDEVLLPVIDRYRAQGQIVVVRADAAFCLPTLYEASERRGVRYAIRLPANDVLERAIEDLLTRPRGRPSHVPLVRYRSFSYQAASWDRPRRVIAKIEHHLGELFPRVGFIVTTLTGTNRAVVRFYNQRGTAEQWIKEGKAATHWTRLSCHRFRANEVRLLLGVIAYNPKREAEDGPCFASMTSLNLLERTLSDGLIPPVRRHEGGETWVHIGNPRPRPAPECLRPPGPTNIFVPSGGRASVGALTASGASTTLRIRC